MENDRIPYRGEKSPPKDGFILAQDEDGNKFWLSTECVKDGPIRHESIDGLLPFIRWQWRKIGHLIHWIDAFEQWELGFMRDSNPGGEVAYWLKVTYAFLKFTEEHPSVHEKYVFDVLVGFGGGDTERTGKKLKPEFVDELIELGANVPAKLADPNSFSDDGELLIEI